MTDCSKRRVSHLFFGKATTDSMIEELLNIRTPIKQISVGISFLIVIKGVDLPHSTFTLTSSSQMMANSLVLAIPPTVPFLIFPHSPLNSFSGQLGIYNFPSTIAIEKVACGWAHTLLITKQGQLYSCGWNRSGQLGLGHNEASVKSAQEVKTLRNTTITQLFTGQEFSLVLSGLFFFPPFFYSSMLCFLDKGDIYTFGGNSYGQLGIGNRKASNVPQKISTIRSNGPVGCGEHHTIIKATDDKLYAFGWAGYGVLGVGDMENDCLSPTQIKLLEERSPIIAISCGTWHSVCCTEDGCVFVWGWNNAGQIGMGQVAQAQTVPVKLSDFGRGRLKATDVTCGARHTVVTTEGDENETEVYLFGFGGPGEPKSNGLPRRLVGVQKSSLRLCVASHWGTFISFSYS